MVSSKIEHGKGNVHKKLYFLHSKTQRTTLKQLGIAKLIRTTQTFKNSKFSSKIEHGEMSFTVKNVSIKGALQSDCMVKRYRFYIKNSC